jgi:hypothetical protein
MRILAVAVAVMLLGSSCGGGEKTTFTNANYQTLVDHASKYDGAHVDVVGQIQTVTHDEEGTPWLLVYVDVKHASQVTLVDVAAGAGNFSERQLVHVVGTVKQGLTVPFDLGGYETAPVVRADKVSAATG